MAKVEIAESSKPRKSAKVLAYIEIHPQLGGGHMIKHVYSDYQHEAKQVKFNEEGKSQGGEHVMKHLMKHAGLPPMEGAEGNGSETEEEINA